MKKRKTKKGGLLKKIGNDNAFGEFLSNSHISLVGSGSSGFAFEVTLVNNDYESPYYSLNHNNFNKKVNCILVKIVLINNVERINLFKNNYKLETTTNKEFEKEVNTQNHIYKETMGYLQPICPSVIHSEVTYDINSLNTLRYIRHFCKEKTEKYILNKIIGYLNNGVIKGIGIIGMEFKKSKILHKLTSNPEFKKYKSMALFLILRLAIETGYNHADYHLGNIFIDEKDETYFFNEKGSPMLIDFGYSFKMPILYVRDIINHVNNKRYVDALEIICMQNRSDGVDLRSYPKLYGWLCTNFDYQTEKIITNKEILIEDINKELIYLHECFEKSNQKRKEIFSIKNAHNKMYPMLPVKENQIIDNKSFKSYYLGGKKKKRSTKKNISHNKTYAIQYSTRSRSNSNI